MAENNSANDGPITSPDEVQWTAHPSTNSKVNKAWRRNIRRYIGSGEQVFETVTTESLFVVESLRRIGAERGCPVIEWDCLRGFTSIQMRGHAIRAEITRLGSPADPEAAMKKKDPSKLGGLGMPGDPRPPAEVLKDPLNALRAVELFQVNRDDVINVLKRPESKNAASADALFIFHNFYAFFGDESVRQLFEHLVGPARLNCNKRRRPIFFVSAPFEGLELKGISVVRHWLHSVPFGLPDEDELLEGCVLPVAAEVKERNGVDPPPELLRASAAGLRGLERHRADCELRAVVGSSGGFTEAVPKAVRRIAASIIASSTQMRLVPDEEIMPPEQLGGVRRVLRALEDAGSTFSDKAKLVKLDPALGMALQGLPGTGKSTIAKVGAEVFRRRTGRPWSTIELRMGAFFDGIPGQMEKNWYDFERREEALGDRIIFIDEFDTFAGVGNSGGLDEARKALFKMQVAWASRPAKGGGRFVIYAMNDPRGIPPEAFREGRIDDVFFFDLPRLGARIDILKIHFAKRLQAIDLPLSALGFGEGDWRTLGERTENWLPGELEGLVKRARNLAFRNGERALPTFGEVMAVIEDRSPHIDYIKQKAKLLELREACKEAEPIDERGGDAESAATTLAGVVDVDGFQAKGMTFDED